MATKNQYENMSAFDALKFADEHTLLLPDIQRNYTWDYTEIEQLFESIINDYPIGSCIFWKTDRKTLNNERPNLYQFLRDYTKNFSFSNNAAQPVFKKETNYYIVLDGQQRITSLYIALYGTYTYYKGGRGKAKKKANSWKESELYYNLDFYQQILNQEIGDENIPKRFCFLTQDEANNGNYFKVKELLQYDNSFELTRSLTNFKEESVRDLAHLFDRLDDNSNNSLIHYYGISEKEYDKALDIFVKVNSAGHKLTKSELLFSTLIDGWKDGKYNGKDIIDKCIKNMNQKGDGFNFHRDFVMRLMLVLIDADTNLKISSFKSDIIGKIRNNWEDIDNTLNTLSDLLTNIGLCDENLTSYNATMPIAYYIFKGGNIESKNAQLEIKKFLSVAMAKNLFGVASNSALNASRNILKNIECQKTPFALSLFAEVKLVGDRTFSVSEKDVDYWMDNYKKGPKTYTILTLLYPNLKLSQNTFHQDHCHADSLFAAKKLRKLNISEDKIVEWQNMKDLLPNLQFLEGSENQHKLKTPLKQWVNEGNKLDFRPEGISLELKDFDEFFKERRKLMKEELLKIFSIKKS